MRFAEKSFKIPSVGKEGFFMMSTSIGAVVIALVITVAAQILYMNGIIGADSRNLCLTSFLVWAGIAMAVFIFGVFAVLRSVFYGMV